MKKLSEYGTVDVLYNGAGIHDSYAKALETTESDYEKVMAVKCKRSFLGN